MNADEFVAEVQLQRPPFSEPEVRVLVNGEYRSIAYAEFESNEAGDRIVIVLND